MSGLEDIHCVNTVPLLSSPSSSHGSVESSSNLDDTSMIDRCQAYRLVGGKEAYDSFEEVAANIRRLGKQQNNCLDEIVYLKGEVWLLKAVIAWLEGDTVAHEAELTISKGEPVWASQERIRESFRAEAAMRMNCDVTPSPPPTSAGAAPSPGPKRVAFNNNPSANFVVVGEKSVRSRRANRQRKNWVAGPTTTKAPDPVPITAQVSSPPTGSAMYSRVAAAPPRLLCRTQLGQGARLGLDWCHLHFRLPPASREDLCVPGFLQLPPLPMLVSATLPYALMLANGRSFLSHPRLSISA